MKQIHYPLKYRLFGLYCLLFGHTWGEYGSTVQDNRILEEYSGCAVCKMEYHDRSGYLRAYEERYGNS